MSEDPARTSVFRSPARDQCWERLIVLRMAGIGVELEHTGREFVLRVAKTDADAALDVLEHHASENRPSSTLPDTAAREPMPKFSKAWLGSLAYAVVLLAFYLASRNRTLDPGWIAVGAAQAGLIREGEWWRVVTALCLHGDVAHLVGNMAFGGLLGLLAGQRFGPGLAWLGILASGALGNALNALVQPATHSSIGASTAVFGSLGLLAAHLWRQRVDSRSRPVERWAPVVSGVLLLAMFGMSGERTDIVAHVTGFGSGILAGWMLAMMDPALLLRAERRPVIGLGALAVVVLAWLAAFATR